MKNFSAFNVLDIEDIFNTVHTTFNDIYSDVDIKHKFIKDEENYGIELVLPSYEKEDITIDFENNLLTVSSDINEGWKKEFKKTFKIKQGIDAENITAELNDGILKIILPRNEDSKSKKIKID